MRIKNVMYLFVALLLPLQSFAEDIDLFVNPPPVADSGPANVLIILDNTANWNTAFENEVEALKDLFFGLDDPNDWNVGLMMFGESPNLGYVRAAIRNMATPVLYDCPTDDNPEPDYDCDIPDDGVDDEVPVTVNFLYGAMIKNFDVSTGEGDGGNARTLARTFAEAYRYLRGEVTVDRNPSTGTGKNVRRDFYNNSIGEKFSDLVFALDPNTYEPHALDDVDAIKYNRPPDNGICGNTYVIYIGNTVPSGNVTKDNNSRNEAAKSDLEAAATVLGYEGDATEKITEGFNYTAHQGNYADEWARLMHEELGIIFYAVDVDPTPYPPEEGGQINGLGNSDLLRSLSQGVGGGEYYRVYSDDDKTLTNVFKEIFNKIQAKNSVFASVALPASTTGNSTFINQVFIGLFRPDASAFPLWPGNLKQYKLDLENPLDISTVALFDANDEPAIDSSKDSGFLDECARSFWTPSEDSTPYWSFDPRGVCIPYDRLNPSPLDTPDGPYVEKGGQGYVMRQVSAPLDRMVFTCDYDITSCTSLTDFVTGNDGITQDMLDPNDPNDPLYQEKDDLIEWAIGKDLEDDDGDTVTDETRAYIHADVIHSRPVAVNYGTDLSPEVVVFYGANDGILRAINGNQEGDFAGADPGEELWAFMPPEYYDQIKWLKLNEKGEPIKFPATGPGSVGRTGIPKPYAVDGPLIAFSGEIKDGAFTEDKKYLIAGMRRGGRSLYAFDITEPGDPEILWKKGCDDSGCASNTGTEVWDDIGQTWSPANIAFLADETNPVLIMGGGYDTCEDTDNGSDANHSCDSNTTGNGIYIIDILNGEILKRLETERSVPGGVTIVTVSDPTIADPNPGIQFAYAADTGGNVYRISGPLVDGVPTPITSGATSVDPSEWAIQPIAVFACGEETDTSCDANRKFLFGPDVVRVSGSIFRILLGSGDREKPLISYSATTAVDNYFYSFVDQPLVADWPDSVDPDDTPATDACGENIVCKSVLFPVSISPDPEKVEAISEDDITAYPLGFALELKDEEQVVTGSLVVGNTAFFSTHIPYELDPNDFAGIPRDEIDRDEYCLSGLGKATTYNIGFEDAGGDLIDIYTGGLVPTPVAGEVLICDGDDCKKVPFCIGCGGDNSPIGGGTVGTGSKYSQAKGRVYWNIEE